MTLINVQLSTPLGPSFRTLQVAGMLDMPLDVRVRHELVAEVPGMEEPWMIGAIVGPSGSGKTTLARAAFGAIDEPRAWPMERAIVEVLGDAIEDAGRGAGVVGRPGQNGGSESGAGAGAGAGARSGSGSGSGSRSRSRSRSRVEDGTRSVPATYATCSIKHITRVLCGVGLGSVPTWLKPYHVLSGGERFRADLARAILSRTEQRSVLRSARRLIVIDEFTSSLDRNLAKATAMAIARLVRRGVGGQRSEVGDQRSVSTTRLVIITCHTDVLPWLAPDWVVDLGAKAGPRLTREPFRQPELKMLVERVPQSLWKRFAGQHYLSNGLAASATCYAALLPGDGKHEVTSHPAAFCAVAATLGWKNTKHIARLVTLAEYQGLGIGGQLLDEVASRESQRANRLTITASHPAILAHCSHSPRWQFVELKKTGSTPQRYQGRPIRSSTGRAVVSFRFTSG